MNEVWNVLTYRDYDFQDNNGRNVRGRIMHCYRPTQDPDWHGCEYAKMSVPYDSEAYRMAPVTGAAYQLSFDRRGKVVSMTAVD